MERYVCNVMFQHMTINYLLVRNFYYLMNSVPKMDIPLSPP